MKIKANKLLIKEKLINVIERPATFKIEKTYGHQTLE